MVNIKRNLEIEIDEEDNSIQKKNSYVNILRQKAEYAMRNIHEISPEKLKSLSALEIHNLMHELRVHQIELEMQNEELRQTQLHLDASRSRYFDLYDLAPIGYCLINENGSILKSNQTMINMLQTSEKEFSARPIFRHIPPNNGDIFYFQLKKLFKTGEGQFCELQLEKKSGELLWVSLVTKIGNDENGKKIAKLVVTDISQKKLFEEKNHKILSEMNSLKFALNEHALISMTGKDKKIIYVNENMCKVSKYSAEELRGQDNSIVNSGIHSKQFMKELRNTIEQGQIWRGEICNKAKDGSFYWVSSTILPFHDALGKIDKFFNVQFEITDEKTDLIDDTFELRQAHLLKVSSQSNENMIEKIADPLSYFWSHLFEENDLKDH